jgi:hypothetical protein
MTIGWTDVTAADTYFSTKRLASTAWDALAVVVGSGGKDKKTAVLNMAYDRLRFHKDFDIPATPTASELEWLALAQHETAYYLALHLADEDLRKGIQAQGVNQAGVVKEVYADAYLSTIPLPPIIYQIMSEFSIADNAAPIYAVDIDRDEDKGVNEDVTDF